MDALLHEIQHSTARRVINILLHTENDSSKCHRKLGRFRDVVKNDEDASLLRIEVEKRLSWHPVLRSDERVQEFVKMLHLFTPEFDEALRQRGSSSQTESGELSNHRVAHGIDWVSLIANDQEIQDRERKRGRSLSQSQNLSQSLSQGSSLSTHERPEKRQRESVAASASIAKEAEEISQLVEKIVGRTVSDEETRRIVEFLARAMASKADMAATEPVMNKLSKLNEESLASLTGALVSAAGSTGSAASSSATTGLQSYTKFVLLPHAVAQNASKLSNVLVETVGIVANADPSSIAQEFIMPIVTRPEPSPPHCELCTQIVSKYLKPEICASLLSMLMKGSGTIKWNDVTIPVVDKLMCVASAAQGDRFLDQLVQRMENAFDPASLGVSVPFTKFLLSLIKTFPKEQLLPHAQALRGILASIKSTLKLGTLTIAKLAESALDKKLS